jgi:Putative Flp pilus-assembly TadE/G-like
MGRETAFDAASAARERGFLRRQAIRAEHGQTLILFVFALPLLLAVIALVTDGSNLFANKRSVQNVADATVLAAVRELNPDFSLCTGPASTVGTCLNKVQTVASDYSDRNGGPTPLHQCDDTSGPDWNCYQTPYPDSTGTAALQIRIKRSVGLRFGGLIGLTQSDVVAKAVAGLGLPGGATNVSPVGVQQQIAACTMPSAPVKCFGPSYPTTLDFDSGGFGYALLNLHCGTATPVTNCGTASPTSEMNTYMETGFPGTIDVNKWYVQNNGAKNGIKQGVDYSITNGTKLLIPVYDCVSVTPPAVVCGPGTGNPAAYHVIGFAAFVIQSRNNWSNGQGHTFTGYFTQYIATGISGGPGGTDFGVHVVSLTQ